MKEDNRSRTYLKISSKNPHSSCVCGMRNHESRKVCLNCGAILWLGLEDMQKERNTVALVQLGKSGKVFGVLPVDID